MKNLSASAPIIPFYPSSCPLLTIFLPYRNITKHSRTPVEPFGHLMDQSMQCLLNAYGLPFYELTSSYCRAETDF